MKISEAANRIKVPIKKIRYYSDIGLIRPSRVNNGYRDFTENDLIKLQLIVKSRSFGFSIKECLTLIKLFENKSRYSKDVKKIAVLKITDIEKKINSLNMLKNNLQKISKHWIVDNSSNCSILDNLTLIN
jgi:Cu(I)-responsive transcriptional regulator